MIKITEKAKTKLLNLILNNKGNSAFLYLKGGGCNGFSYKFKILNNYDKINKLDEKFKLNNNNNLYICNSSLMYILGTEIDYIEDIMGSRFDFKNNKINSKCGCGTSFSFID